MAKKKLASVALALSTAASAVSAGDYDVMMVDPTVPMQKGAFMSEFEFAVRSLNVQCDAFENVSDIEFCDAVHKSLDGVDSRLYEAFIENNVPRQLTGQWAVEAFDWASKIQARIEEYDMTAGHQFDCGLDIEKYVCYVLDDKAYAFPIQTP